MQTLEDKKLAQLAGAPCAGYNGRPDILGWPGLRPPRAATPRASVRAARATLCGADSTLARRSARLKQRGFPPSARSRGAARARCRRRIPACPARLPARRVWPGGFQAVVCFPNALLPPHPGSAKRAPAMAQPPKPTSPVAAQPPKPKAAEAAADKAAAAAKAARRPPCPGRAPCVRALLPRARQTASAPLLRGAQEAAKAKVAAEAKAKAAAAAKAKKAAEEKRKREEEERRRASSPNFFGYEFSFIGKGAFLAGALSAPFVYLKKDEARAASRLPAAGCAVAAAAVQAARRAPAA